MTRPQMPPVPAATIEPLDRRAPHLLGLLPRAAVLLDGELDVRFVFPTNSRRAGFVPTNAEEAQASDWVHPDDVPDLERALERVKDVPGGHSEVTIRARTESGEWHVVEVALDNLLDDPDVQAIVVSTANLSVYEREARYRELFAQSPVAILETDTDGRCRFVNQSWTALTGQPADVALGTGYAHAVHPDDWDEMRVTWRAVLAEQQAVTKEFRFLRPDGEVVWVRGRCGPLRASSGEATGFLATFTDISDRHRVEELMRENASRLRSVLDNSSDIVVVLDRDGSLTYVSPAAQRVLGYDPETFLGTSVFDLVHPDDIDFATEAFVSTTRAAGQRPPLELRVRHADGSYRAVEVVANSLVGDPVVQGVIINARDLTDRLNAEQVLREAETRFQQVFELAAVGMGITDLEGRFTRVNKALCEMLGFTRPQLRAQSIDDLVHPDDLREAQARFAEVIAGERSTLTLEQRLRRCDGTWIWTRTSLSVMRDDHGRATHVIRQTEDVTEGHRMREQLEFDATHDRLTGLPSRAVLVDHLERALARAERRGNPVAALFIDLDGFKVVNDTFGHAAGDALLVHVAERLRCAIRESDVPVRIGGDEFVVLCPDVDAECALRIAERIVEALKEPCRTAEREVACNASIGVALSSGSSSAEQLLAEADVAAYRAKRSGGARVEIFDEVLRQQLKRRRAIAGEVKRAIDAGPLPLRLWPIVDVSNGDAIGFEAEIDWETAGLDAKSAPEMIEAAGLTRAVDAALVDTMARQLGEWQRHSPGPRVPGLSAMLGAASVRGTEIVDAVRNALTEHQANPALLWLGLPEVAFAQDLESASRTACALSRLDLAVALREFGAGFSSLEHLRQVPVPCLVLAPSLVEEADGDDPAGTELVRAIVRVAHKLGRVTMASGVRSATQLALLRNLGCNLCLGPAFGPPIGVEGVGAALAERYV